jgi:hypothetical protein
MQGAPALATGLCISVITQIYSWNWQNRGAAIQFRLVLISCMTRNEHSRTSLESRSAPWPL